MTAGWMVYKSLTCYLDWPNELYFIEIKLLTRPSSCHPSISFYVNIIACNKCVYFGGRRNNKIVSMCSEVNLSLSNDIVAG